MWSFKAGLVAVLMLAACGFSPAYAPGGRSALLQDSIEAAEPRDKSAFDLVERIEERLGPSDNPRFALDYQIRLKPVGVGITPDNAITRYNLTGVVDWQLNDKATGARVTSGQAMNFASYSATGSTMAGLSAQEDATLRLMRMLADQIVSQLLATANQWGKQGAGQGVEDQ